MCADVRLPVVDFGQACVEDDGVPISVTSVIGCGVTLQSNGATRVFFTLDGELLGTSSCPFSREVRGCVLFTMSCPFPDGEEGGILGVPFPSQGHNTSSPAPAPAPAPAPHPHPAMPCLRLPPAAPEHGLAIAKSCAVLPWFSCKRSDVNFGQRAFAYAEADSPPSRATVGKQYLHWANAYGRVYAQFR